MENIIFPYDKFMKVRKKLCLLSTLKLKLKDKEITFANCYFYLNDFVCVPNDSTEELVLLRDDDFLKVEESFPVIIYIAGYVCFAVNNKLKCIYFKSLMTCDRGDSTEHQGFFH